MKITKKYLQKLIREETTKQLRKRAKTNENKVPSVRRPGYMIDQAGAAQETAKIHGSLAKDLDNNLSVDQITAISGAGGFIETHRRDLEKIMALSPAERGPKNPAYNAWASWVKKLDEKSMKALFRIGQWVSERGWDGSPHTNFADVFHYIAYELATENMGARVRSIPVREGRNISEQLKWRRGIHPIAKKNY